MVILGTFEELIKATQAAISQVESLQEALLIVLLGQTVQSVIPNRVIV